MSSKSEKANSLVTLILCPAQPSKGVKRVSPAPPHLADAGFSLEVPPWRAQHWLYHPALLAGKVTGSEGKQGDSFQTQSPSCPEVGRWAAAPSTQLNFVVPPLTQYPAEGSGDTSWKLLVNETKRTKALGRL